MPQNCIQSGYEVTQIFKLLCLQPKRSTPKIIFNVHHMLQLSGKKITMSLFIIVSQNFAKSANCCTWYYIKIFKTRGFLTKKRRILYMVPKRGKCLLFNDQLFSKAKFVWESISDKQLCVRKSSLLSWILICHEKYFVIIF